MHQASLYVPGHQGGIIHKRKVGRVRKIDGPEYDMRRIGWWLMEREEYSDKGLAVLKLHWSNFWEPQCGVEGKKCRAEPRKQHSWAPPKCDVQKNGWSIEAQCAVPGFIIRGSQRFPECLMQMVENDILIVHWHRDRGVELQVLPCIIIPCWVLSKGISYLHTAKCLCI